MKERKRTKNRLYALFAVFFAVILLAIAPMGAASAEEPTPTPTPAPTATPAPTVYKNLFDMDLFEREIDHGLDVTDISPYGILLSVPEERGDNNHYTDSGYLNLDPGIYTFSLRASYPSNQLAGRVLKFSFYGMENEQFFNELTITDALVSIYNVSFTLVKTTSLYLRVRAEIPSGESFAPLIGFKVYNIQLEKGETATSFTPYGVPEPETQPPTQADWDKFLEGMNDLFKSDSGIIAGASLGSFIILCVIAVLAFKRIRK